MSSSLEDRFTERARKVLMSAQREAKRLGDNVVGTQHLLLGLLQERNGLAAKVLNDNGVSIARVKRIISEHSENSGDSTSPSTTLSPRTRRVIEVAVEEARRLDNKYIDTEHLLLGLLSEKEGLVTDVLQDSGIEIDIVRESIRSSKRQEPKKRKPSRPSRGKAGSQQTPMMDQLGVDLTAKAHDSKLDPVIGRQNEIERVIQILSRRTKNNAALIGEPGVGKTAIVEGLAQRIADGDVPPQLRDKNLLMMDVGSLVAGTIYRGQFEERMKQVIDELKETEAILFIDEMQMLVGAGSAGSSVDAANLLKPALARGELQVIGATTLDEYRRHVESDSALDRRFQPVYVDEPSVEDAVKILHGIRSRYEAHHNLKISDDALQAAVHLADRYISDRYLPDKAIDLIDEASSRVRMYKMPDTEEVNLLIKELSEVRVAREDAMTSGDEDLEADMAVREREIVDEIEVLRTEDDESMIVNDEDIAEIVSMWTGVQVIIDPTAEGERFLQMEQALRERIVSQEEAISAISKAVKRARAGMKDPRRPIGVYIFLGPTGVGKTELAKALAEFMFGSEDALLQIDMSEFMERHAVARLVGAPPGYVGYFEGGQLTEAVRRRPYQIILLDEIEKAHPEVFNMMLQIMEEGHLSDAKGRKVDFSNTIVIMTSNIGADRLTRQQALGFELGQDEQDQAKSDYAEMSALVHDEMKRTFKPEFLNRVDKSLVFHPLTREDLRKIVDIQLDLLQPRLDDHGLALDITDAARERLVDSGYNPEYGARPLRSAIRDLLEDPLSDLLLAGEIANGDTVFVDADSENDDQLRIAAVVVQPA